MSSYKYVSPPGGSGRPGAAVGGRCDNGDYNVPCHTPRVCPNFSKVVQLSTNSGDGLDHVIATCDDAGQTQLRFGGGESNQQPIDALVSSDLGFDALTFDQSGWMQGEGVPHTVHGVGTSQQIPPNNTNLVCPDGMVLTGMVGSNVGIHGKQVVGELGLVCDYQPEYCVTNLESPYCQSYPPNADILNRACAQSMTQTCKDRQSELKDSTVSTYCNNKANASDPFCSCYNAIPPAAIAKYPEIASNPKCWSGQCAVNGYQPANIRNTTCPTITICEQDLATSGNSNILTNNIITQNCNSNNTTNSTPGDANSTPTGSTTPSNSNSTTASNSNGTGTSSSINNLLQSTYFIYIVAFILMFVVVYYAFFDDDDEVNNVNGTASV